MLRYVLIGGIVWVAAGATVVALYNWAKWAYRTYG
jgi:hypothetical protein